MKTHALSFAALRSLGLFLLCLSWFVPLRAGEDAGDFLRTLRRGHPRLFLTTERFGEMQKEADEDPLLARLNAEIVAAAERQWREPPLERVLVGPRLLQQSRKALERIADNAYAYRLTGDRRYADFAIDQMLTAAKFEDWHPSHFLDVAEMAAALAIGYDWLYEELGPERRQLVRTALYDKALVFAPIAHACRRPAPDWSFPFVKESLRNNWNQVCNGGLTLAALALADEEPEMASLVLRGVRKTLPFALAEYGPDGAYPEGPSYWSYGTTYTGLLVSALESALGSDLGLCREPAVALTARYRIQATGPLGLSFNYADGPSRIGVDAAVTWLGQRFDDPYVVAWNRERLGELLARQNTEPGSVRLLITHALWFPSVKKRPASPPELAIAYRGSSQVAFLRSAWDDPKAVWVGLKAGSNRVNHGHLDLGSFVLDADGVRWALDLGPDDYNLPGYWTAETIESPRWKIYRMSNLSHNTLSPEETRQDPDAIAGVERCGKLQTGSYAVARLDAAYPSTLSAWSRGVELRNDRSVLVQDELKAKMADATLVWRMLTEAKVSVASSGRSAVLEKDGRTLQALLLEPEDARFSSHPATPPTRAENQNEGVTALEGRFSTREPGSSVRVRVLLVPQSSSRSAPENSPVPLSEWK